MRCEFMTMACKLKHSLRRGSSKLNEVKNGEQSKSNDKTMLIVFFDQKGVVHLEYRICSTSQNSLVQKSAIQEDS